MDKLLSREDMKVIKGIAIILMLLHHLWGFPDRIAGGSLNYLFSIFDQSSIMYLGMFGKICVPIFFFGGGYGVYISYYGKKYDVVEKLKKLYIAYWKVFVVFIPIAFWIFSNQPAYCENEEIYTCFSSFRWCDYIANFWGISSSYNGAWWFLNSYVFALISFPVVRFIADRHSSAINILIVIIASILVTNFFPAIGRIEIIGTLNNNYLYSRLVCQRAPYIACFWMGVVVAKDGLLDRLKESMCANNVLNPIMDIIIWGVVIYLRQTGIGDRLDIFYIPLLVVVSMDFIERLKIVRKILLEIGKQSTNMWLTHCFFCYYFYSIVKIVVASRWAVPSLLTLIILTYLSSVVLTYFWKSLFILYERIKQIRIPNKV